MRYVESGTEPTHPTDGSAPPGRDLPSPPSGTLQQVLRCLSGRIRGGYGASLRGLNTSYAQFSVSGTRRVGFFVLIFPDDIFDRVSVVSGRLLTTTNNLLPPPPLSVCVRCACNVIIVVVVVVAVVSLLSLCFQPKSIGY